MAQAGDESSTPRARVARAPTVRREVYVQPGVRLSSEVCREIGIPELRGQIVNGKRKAFDLHPGTGTMEVIKPERFRAESAVETLQRGFYFVVSGSFEYVDDEREWVADYHPVFVVVENIPTVSVAVPAPATMPAYIPPFLGLMLEAVQEFKITADNPAPPKKHLIEYFEGKIVDGWTVSANQADMLATFVRAPDAIKGGKR